MRLDQITTPHNNKTADDRSLTTHKAPNLNLRAELRRQLNQPNIYFLQPPARREGAGTATENSSPGWVRAGCASASTAGSSVRSPPVGPCLQDAPAPLRETRSAVAAASRVVSERERPVPCQQGAENDF